jgi:hypothetical protein
VENSQGEQQLLSILQLQACLDVLVQQLTGQKCLEFDHYQRPYIRSDDSA